MLPLAVVGVMTALPLSLAGDPSSAMEASAMFASVSDQMVTQVTEVARQLSHNNSDLAVSDSAVVLPRLEPVFFGMVIERSADGAHGMLIPLSLIDLPPPTC